MFEKVLMYPAELAGGVLIANLYNRSVPFWKRKISAEEVMTVLEERDALGLHSVAPKGVDPATVIMIAKAICKGASFVCPIVDKL